MVKESACNAGDVGWICGLNPWVGIIPCRKEGCPLQCLAWRIPWTEEPGGLQSMGSQRVGYEHTHTYTHMMEKRIDR